jgi:hypothetical protein
MKKNTISNLLSVIAVITLFAVMAGCGKGSKETTQKTTENKTTENKTTENKTTNNNTAEKNTSGALSYDVVNNTGVTLVDVFVTPAETNHWGNDILPNNLFEAGSTIKVTIPPDYGETCMFDMKITDAAGGHITFTNIDACKLVKLQINADATYEYLATK